MALFLKSHDKHRQLASSFNSEINPSFINKVSHVNADNFFAANHKPMCVKVKVFNWGIVFKVSQKLKGCPSIVFDENFDFARGFKGRDITVFKKRLIE